MVTGAPVSNSGVVKRADETIVFGNQQNKARVVNKRSDMPNTPELGELDKESDVVVHEEKPVDEDLANRADAARKDFEDQNKIADAMEAAMQSVDTAESDLEQLDETDTPQAKESEQIADEASATSDNAAGLEQIEAEEQGEADQNVANEDSDIEDLLKVAGEGRTENDDRTEEQTTGEDQSLQVEQSPEPITNVVNDEVSAGGSPTDIVNNEDSATGNPTGTVNDENSARGIPTEVQSQPDNALAPQSGDSNDQLDDFWTQMYQYMDAYPGSARLPFDLYRERRSLVRSKKSGQRRIKRDLLDDFQYDPDLPPYLYSAADEGISNAQDDQYNPPTSSVLDMGDSLLADQDGYVPLTDSDAEELYNELEEYLQWELQRQAGMEKLRETLGLAPRQEADLSSLYGGEVESGDGGADDDSLVNSPYSYGGEYPSESPYYYAAKRNSPSQSVYDMPLTDTDKRYFFPFADEPETHWGAFVPEKRTLEDTNDERDVYLDDAYLDEYRGPSKQDYNEAIQRLQRLAMALSDNHDPYYTELVQDPYKK